jgi:3-dehydro-L-gulonate 2-dehydrogenase
MGYWKGAGLALMLDLLSVILAGGKATHEVDKQGGEYGLSQVFIAIDISRLDNFQAIPSAVAGILKDYQESMAINKEKSIVYPGERVLLTRKQNTLKGIPVQKEVWEKILSL